MITINVPVRQSHHFRTNSSTPLTSFPRLEKSPNAEGSFPCSPKSNVNMSKSSYNLHHMSPPKSPGLASIMELQQKRRMLDNNARMLSSRLQALTQEQRRIQVHTEGIKKKTHDLLIHRLGREDKKKEKEANQSFRGPGEKTLTEQRQTNVEWRSHHTLELERLRETIYDEKRKEAQKRKEEKMENLEKIQESKTNKLNGLKTIYLKGKEKEGLVPGHVRRAWEHKLEPVRQSKEKMLRAELERIEMKEYELKQLDKQENHMLERLCDAEDTEFKARDRYHEIRLSPAADLMEKYKYYMPKRPTLKFNKTVFSCNKLTMKSF